MGRTADDETFKSAVLDLLWQPPQRPAYIVPGRSYPSASPALLCGHLFFFFYFTVLYWFCHTSVGGLRSQEGCIPVLMTTSAFFYYHLPPALTLCICMPHFPIRLAQRKRFTVIYEDEVHLLLLLPGLSLYPMLTMNVSLQAFELWFDFITALQF